MPPTWVDIRTPPVTSSLGLIVGYGEVVVEVADAARAHRFYADLLGFARDGTATDGPRLRVGPGQHVVLAERAAPRTLCETGAHAAYRLPSAEHRAALARLEAAGVAVHRYHEDRAAEADANYYCADPDGNRVQLVAGDAPGIDHAAVETHDLEWSEVFYTQVLGGQVETRVGWHMDDYARAHAWGAGGDQCAPGTRRWDKPYTVDIATEPLARPNPQTFVAFAPGVVLGLYLATEHRQEAPPDQLVGTPRLGLRLRPDGLAEAAERLRALRLRCMWAAPDTGGPFARAGNCLYVRDPGGNFLALAE
ncbi:MAG TPA: VOC family protein [Chloroflexota bacterium]|jgi:catechol 2,3-dioxygenase-like lactoylglutathione lyase family enzyme